MEYGVVYDYAARNNTASKLKDMIYKYLEENYRYPELILIDPFSLVDLTDEKIATTILDMPTKFMGIPLQVIQTPQCVIVLQRSNPTDILHDVARDAKKQFEAELFFENMYKKEGK